DVYNPQPSKEGEMRRHRPWLFWLLLGYQATALAAPVHGRSLSLPYRRSTTTAPHWRVMHAPLPRRSVRSPGSARVIATLMAQLGKPYRWGGSSPQTGFDCSGLVYYSWHQSLDIRLPRTAKGMYHMAQAKAVPRTQLQPGDMVFFAMGGEEVDHVGVYVGNGHFIEAPHTGESVKLVSLDKDNYRRHYLGARRVVPAGREES
ncbi:C40 family peptidase, partial [Serratia ureilytica]|uniref:C40 family peptidase n=2 Tax=Serratia TaxID=613 RepID=UPI0018D86AB1